MCTGAAVIVMKFLQGLNIKRLMIYCMIISFVASGVFSILFQNKPIVSLGKRAIYKKDIAQILGDNLSPNTQELTKIYNALLANMRTMHNLDELGIIISDEVIRDYIRKNYTKEQFNAKSEQTKSAKLAYLELSNSFINNFLKSIVQIVQLSPQHVNQAQRHIAQKKMAYYKFITNEEIINVHKFSTMSDDEKNNFCVANNFIKAAPVSYQTHFQNNTDCNICKYARKLCSKCSSNICLCDKCFVQNDDDIDRDLAASIIMSPKDAMSVYITADNKIIAVYVYEIDDDDSNHVESSYDLHQALNADLSRILLMIVPQFNTLK